MRTRALALGVALAACSPTTIVTPTRSLDAPSDIALVCATPTVNGTLMQPLGVCNLDTITKVIPDVDAGTTSAQQIQLGGIDMGDPGQDMGTNYTPGQLFGFVANTARGEVALVAAQITDLWTSDSTGAIHHNFVTSQASIVDTDQDKPGFGFLPVGGHPDHIRASDDGCLAVTSNTDTCDLAVINVLEVLRLQTGEAHGNTFPASVVAHVVPRAADGTPLGARPTWIELLPRARDFAQNGCATPSADKPYTALVAFPGCGLVGRVRLDTGVLVEAMRVTPGAAVPISDLAGVRCPAECAGIPVTPPSTPPDLGGTPLDQASSPDDAGEPIDASMSIDASMIVDASMPPPSLPDMSLPPLVPTSESLPHALAIDTELERVFIADAASDRILVVARTGEQWLSGGVRSVTLVPAGGVTLMRLSQRITDPTIAGDPGIKYLYAIARDQTVRVVNADDLVECETNPDPRIINGIGHCLTDADCMAGVLCTNHVCGDRSQSYVYTDLPASHSPPTPDDPQVLWPNRIQHDLRCLPIGKTPRAQLATGPGISLPGGSLPRDIAFTHLNVPPDATVAPAVSANPALLIGDAAWIVDSAGRATAVNLADRCPQPNDPNMGTSNLTPCAPTAFPPSVAEFRANVGFPAPTAMDLMPNRLRSANSRFLGTGGTDPNGMARLSSAVGPTVTAANAIDTEGRDLPSLCLVPQYDTTNPDAAVETPVGCINELDRDDPTGSGVFVNFPDPNAVYNENWTLVWEGELNGTARTAGAIGSRESDKHDRIVGTLHDSSAGLCARGVRPGDKLYLVGCSQDSDCRLGELCLLDPGRPATANGMCVSSTQLLAAQTLCTPWTQSYLRYRLDEVSGPGASGGEVATFGEIAEPEYDVDLAHGTGHPSTWIPTCQSPEDCAGITVADGKPTSCLDDGRGVGTRRCVRECNPLKTDECGLGYLCAQSVAGGTRCLRAPLPPLAGTLHDLCFGAPQAYEIHAGESWVVSGDQSGVIENESEDPSTHRCVRSFDADPVLRYRNARLPMAPPDCPADLESSDWYKELPPEFGGNACSLNPADGYPRRYIRFSNPFFDIVMVVPPQGLPLSNDGGWVDSGGNTEISHVPFEGTFMSFSTVGGFRPMTYGLGTAITAQSPSAATVGGDRHAIYIVDQGKQNSATGLRGQVIRFLTDSESSDPTFVIR